MPDVSTLTLNNGVVMPALGLGVFQTPPDETRAAVSAALEAEYRLADPTIGDIARAHGKTPAQAMLRWHLLQGRSVIPKSTKPAGIAKNIDVFDFDLSTDELAAIDALDTGQRGGPEPEAITLENFGRPIPED
jgi:diketogulonate reductase-like aldo/keto reductase